jgi:hypothetical protein
LPTPLKGPIVECGARRHRNRRGVGDSVRAAEPFALQIRLSAESIRLRKLRVIDDHFGDRSEQRIGVRCVIRIETDREKFIVQGARSIRTRYALRAVDPERLGAKPAGAGNCQRMEGRPVGAKRGGG